MDKDYMLQAVQARIGVLEQQYISSLDKNNASTKVIRSNTKRDLCILLLIEQLLFSMKDNVIIDNADAELGLEKLCKI